MVNACETDRESALIRCLYSSGARISEVLALRWQDVTPRDNGGAVLYIADGKGHKDREAGVSAAAYAALLRLRDEDTPDGRSSLPRNGLPVTGSLRTRRSKSPAPCRTAGQCLCTLAAS